MKPQDLKVPFFWEERSTKIKDNVLYVPEHYFKHHQFIMPSWEEFFGNDNPISCELCSGNGDWVVAQAKETPEVNWIAVEKRFDRVRKIWSKMHNCRVTNLRIVCGDAQTFFLHYLGEAVVQRIIVNFPDPWPKSRHRKHRLFQDEFLNNVVRVLTEPGILILATDDKNYLLQAIQIMRQYLSPTMEDPYYCEVENYGNSWFETLWRSKGREIFYTEFVKKLGYS
ncbi:tRNA/rRNA methyltransferase [Chlamydia felis Fe/C-56]|uniref:tRNA (guanine-N(7)-)-methyltransferase n=1 Tax=Chlamydia felis (strain Fe/C-56) TaxID=264202 RepID=TRMB_CHLFF|nr:tRNA (guanosine(46)-N7)-methyltransferase TrmB [Chlamydia felis]Q255M7.1 RecName: Full=tRNA (guanine-N(7)-)-methyltransferase; AltName: Full=tRNA (guanine(46)-N(7))-methyltransferase; AltName: Full=tRNA(m7G46)-methyltransferase [Chlamydia felis Fe/C-56]BAE81011.1 tRNA/rRNA methyltransferase [Chlamydia felis Fe/C-56]